MNDRSRIEMALEMIVKYGGIDGDHHKSWVLDQVTRFLTGCPWESIEGKDPNGQPYTFLVLGESEEYKKLVADARDGEDGPQTYGWETGTPP